MFLVVGLGNPGRQYEGTNHNVGFYAIDMLAEELGVAFLRTQCKALTAEYLENGQKIVLAKPQTYMNLSGESVRQFVQMYKIPLENIIVISDDIDLDVGVVRYREKGSAGTHNGLRSMVQCLGSGDFKRIRIGIGRGEQFADLADFVLSKITKENQPKIERAVKEAVEMILKQISQTIKGE